MRLGDWLISGLNQNLNSDQTFKSMLSVFYQSAFAHHDGSVSGRPRSWDSPE